jgi:hypothetical protein
MKTQQTEHGAPDFVRHAVQRARHHWHDRQGGESFGPGPSFGRHGFG